jgi:hypothetical protein
MEFMVTCGLFEAVYLCGAGEDGRLTRDAVVWGALVHHVENALSAITTPSPSSSSRWTGDLAKGCATFADDSGYVHAVAFSNDIAVGASYEVDAEGFEELEEGISLSELPVMIQDLWRCARDAMEADGAPGASGICWVSAAGEAQSIGVDRVSGYARIPFAPSPAEADLVATLAHRAWRGPCRLKEPERVFLETRGAGSTELVAHGRKALAEVGIAWS